jgi:hypothetical protein
MAPRLKQDYPALMAEYDQRLSAGETPQAIKAAFQARGIHWGTFQNHRTKAKKGTQETPMSIQIDPPPEVLPGQLSIEDTDTPAEDTMSTIVDMSPVNGEVSEPLSPDEVLSLEGYEQIIAQGIKTFVQVGHALLTIREQRLYRESYTTFEDYCRQRWDLSRPRAYQLIDAAQVIDVVSTIVDIVPVNEAQARPLASLPAEQQVEVWREVVETAPAGKVTAKHVQETVKRVKVSPTTTRTPTPKPFDVEVVERRIREEFMDWLRHCGDQASWKRADNFIGTLAGLVFARADVLGIPITEPEPK